MTEKSEALRLADVLDHVELRPSDYKDVDKAAAELRRLHAENERLTTLLADVGQVEAELAEKSDEVHRLHAVNAELLEALRLVVHLNERDVPMTDEELRVCRAAIAKAEGEKT